MLTGRPPDADPASAMPPRAVRAGVPRDLDAIVRQAMAADPDDRFQTVQAMATALSRPAAGAGGGVGAPGEPRELPPAPTGPDVTPARGFLRHEGRLLGWTLALVAVAAVLVAIGLTLARDDLGDLFGNERSPGTAGSNPGTSAGAAPSPIELAGAIAYDPQGDDRQENNAASGRAVDGDAGSSWGTSTYQQPFGDAGLKDGVGLVLDPGRAERARQLTLALNAAGADFSVYATDAETIPDDIDGWQRLTTRDGAGRQVNVRLDGNPYRYYLVWFTNLPPAGDGYRIEVAEAGLKS
jgi:hypothetical protein